MLLVNKTAFCQPGQSCSPLLHTQSWPWTDPAVNATELQMSTACAYMPSTAAKIDTHQFALVSHIANAAELDCSFALVMCSEACNLAN